MQPCALCAASCKLLLASSWWPLTSVQSLFSFLSIAVFFSNVPPGAICFIAIMASPNPLGYGGSQHPLRFMTSILLRTLAGWHSLSDHGSWVWDRELNLSSGVYTTWQKGFPLNRAHGMCLALSTCVTQCFSGSFTWVAAPHFGWKSLST